MTFLALLAGVALTALGAAVTLTTIRSLKAAGGASVADYIAGLDGTALTESHVDPLAEPFFARVVRPLGTNVVAKLVTFTPSGYLDKTHHQLLLAGLTASIRAEEFAAATVLLAAVGFVLSFGWVVLADPATNIGLLGLVAIPAVFLCVPQAWLKRKVSERKERIFKDLPDVLDLMAMAVEAGTAFEGALALVAREFKSPLAEELSRTLQEMELGLPRREALQNLKRRTEVPELSNFVLALTQADALGMPIGRILHVQAGEMRLRRRQWAREKAGKLPVKIVFPLVIFIFPAVLVVILGPAFGSIFQAFK